MAKRFRIGLNFFFDNQTNSGIVNYIFNILSALKTLEDEKKPEVIVFYSQTAPVYFLKQVNYPYIRFYSFLNNPSNIFIKKINSILKQILKLDLYKKIRIIPKVDCLYPYFEFIDKDFAEVKNKIHWLVDFNNRAFSQHYHDNGKSMIEFQERLAQCKDEKVVLSSYTLLEELKQYYPNYKFEVRVLRFASSLPDLSNISVHEVLLKYSITDKYFMSPNQFWEHKNQIIVLEALRLIKYKMGGLKFKVLFTGSLEVNRGKGKYAEMLAEKVKEYDLQDYIQFLGVVERSEQLVLMKHAVSLIQPSLYEGWSTLVEEAKALDKHILLSDLAVHKEQIANNVSFFDPFNAVQLADLLIMKFTDASLTHHDYNYDNNIKQFGIDILKVLTA